MDEAGRLAEAGGAGAGADVSVSHGCPFCGRGLPRVVAVGGSSPGTSRAVRSVGVPWPRQPQTLSSARMCLLLQPGGHVGD